MKHTVPLLMMLFMAMFSKAQSPYPNRLVGNVGLCNEPTICISPVDTLLMTAAANLNLFYFSNDGGLGWGLVQAQSQYGVFGDPCIVADTTGAFLYFHLAQNPAITVWPKYADRIVCQKTTDLGGSWAVDTFTGHNAPHMQDKEWSAVDPMRNYIYTAWTQFDEYGSDTAGDSTLIRFSRSEDAGASWSPAITIGDLQGDCLDGDNTIEGAMPAVGPNGEVYLAYALNDKIYFNKSTDYGNTWLSSEVVVANQLEGWDYDIPGIYRCNGMPVLHCDLSGGPHTGTLYLNWTDKHIANDADVFFSKSIDGGDTWSSPLRVNDDSPNADNFMSWMTVDQKRGDIYIVYYDRRNHPGTTLTDVYLARSTDGGNTFSNFRISQTPFVAQANVFNGDYINISAVNGCVRPIWTRQDTGKTSVWTAIVSFNDTSATQPNALTHLNAFETNWRLMSENPTKGRCVISIGDVSDNAVVRLFSVTGQLIYEWQNLNAKSFLKFNMSDFGLQSSIYFVRCYDNSSNISFPLIYSR